ADIAEDREQLPGVHDRRQAGRRIAEEDGRLYWSAGEQRRGAIDRRVARRYFPPTSLNQSSSVSTLTPCLLASASFEPAPGPATTRSVFFDTEPDTLAPSRSAVALASSRVIFSSEPVNTTVLPAIDELLLGFSASMIVTSLVSRSTMPRLWLSPKYAATLLITVSPIWSIASISAMVSSSPWV